MYISYIPKIIAYNTHTSDIIYYDEHKKNIEGFVALFKHHVEKYIIYCGKMFKSHLLSKFDINMTVEGSYKIGLKETYGLIFPIFHSPCKICPGK